jgi:class 3 adenylate cyclase
VVPEGPVEEHAPKRKLTTILCADCAGFSRMMRADEERTYRILQDCRKLIDRLVGEHEGRIFGSAGDSVVAEFPSPVEAVRCATEIQQAIELLEAESPEERRMHFRIGINLGDVIIQGDDLIGDGVNVAARLQGLSDPGGICISGTVYEQIKNKLMLACDDLGDQIVKNIADPASSSGPARTTGRTPTGDDPDCDCAADRARSGPDHLSFNCNCHQVPQLQRAKPSTATVHSCLYCGAAIW